MQGGGGAERLIQHTYCDLQHLAATVSASLFTTQVLIGRALRAVGCFYFVADCGIAVRHLSDWVWCQATLLNKVSPFCIHLIPCSFFSSHELLCCGTAWSDRPHRRPHHDHPAGLSPVLFAHFYKAFLVLPVYWHCLLISPLVQNRTKTECVFSSMNTSDAVVLKFTALAVTSTFQLSVESKTVTHWKTII